jgi:FkbM family methyltransferase
MTPVLPNIVFDLGFHRGEDTRYYLNVGYNVVAVEADPSLYNIGCKHFQEEIKTGRLVLLHAALTGITRNVSSVSFYPHPVCSEWGSIDQRWIQRNNILHKSPHAAPVHVRAVNLTWLIEHYGNPYYIKIDIEGADEEVVYDIRKLSVFPSFISWETGKESFFRVAKSHMFLHGLGYRKFRIVQQAYMDTKAVKDLKNQKEYTFEAGSSGAMPHLLPDTWCSLYTILFFYLLLFVIYALIGPKSYFSRASHSYIPFFSWGPKKIKHWADKRNIPFPGWFDSHAMISS